ncbi:aldose 1-epimerase [Vibrio maritimus]|uniref:Aldose 1-epimerase n=1 Tax=Vibrio maritimus TaxID=990268 RepID=A0A090SEP2_9VIBR|nr:aldose 1-epimerase [Vibrio maritimus]
MGIEFSGIAKDGQAPKLVTLSNAAGMEITVMDIGAAWLSCKVPVDNSLREVLLGVSSIEDYERQQVYLGSTVGRYANRIAGGKFSIDGNSYQVDTNQAGNCLHGGRDGFDKRRWSIVKQTPNSVAFELTSHDGDQGFPGELKAQVCYALSDENAVTIEYQASTTKATTINLTNHAYFNLLSADGDDTILGHSLRLDTEYYLPTNSVGIPLGDSLSSRGSAFDFTVAKTLDCYAMEDEQLKQAKGYDHCYVSTRPHDEDKPLAWLQSPDDKVVLTVSTTKPGIQVYTGNWLAGTPNRKGGVYSDYQGIALETQYLPDSPNRSWTDSNAILYPTEHYLQCTTYAFRF